MNVDAISRDAVEAGLEALPDRGGSGQGLSERLQVGSECAKPMDPRPADACSTFVLYDLSHWGIPYLRALAQQCQHIRGIY